MFGTHNDSTFLEYAAGESQLFYDRDSPTFEERRIELLANEASFRALLEKSMRVAVNRSAVAAASYRFVDRGIRRALTLARLEAAVQEPAELASPEQLEQNFRFYISGLESLLSYIETAGAAPVIFWEYLLLMVEDNKPLTEYERSVADFLKRYTGGMTEEQQEMKREVLRRVTEHLASRNRHFIDPIEPMRNHRGEIFNDYLHYSAEGNLWAARVIAKEMRPLVGELLEQDPVGR